MLTSQIRNIKRIHTDKQTRLLNGARTYAKPCTASGPCKAPTLSTVYSLGPLHLTNLMDVCTLILGMKEVFSYNILGGFYWGMRCIAFL